MNASNHLARSGRGGYDSFMGDLSVGIVLSGNINHVEKLKKLYGQLDPRLEPARRPQKTGEFKKMDTGMTPAPHVQGSKFEWQWQQPVMP